MSERTISFANRDWSIFGPELAPGDKVNDVTLTDGSDAFTAGKFRLLADTSGKTRLISVIPSIQTGVCATQTRRMNEVAAQMGENVAVLTVSADLPMAQATWCGAAGVEQVTMLSDHYDMTFGETFGTHILDLRIEMRALFVVDADDVVRYAEYVPVIGDEPDYDNALAALQKVVS